MDVKQEEPAPGPRERQPSPRPHLPSQAARHMKSMGGTGPGSRTSTPPQQPATTRTVLRNACDFCHSKRIKCKSVEGSKCQQCTQRGIECKFSVKEKTGPKPRPQTQVKLAPEVPVEPVKQPVVHPTLQVVRLDELNGIGRVATIPYTSPTKSTSSSAASAGRSPPQEHHHQPRVPAPPPQHHHQVPPPRSPAQAAPAPPALAPSDVTASAAALAARVAQEWGFLKAYLSSAARLLPLCDPKELRACMAARKALLLDRAAAGAGAGAVTSVRGAGGGSVADAELTAALAVGALICNQPAAGESYQAVAQGMLAELAGTAPGPQPELSPALCMLAFFGQYQGDMAMRELFLTQALQHAYGGGSGSAGVSLHVQLCMEHLDYARATEPWAHSAAAQRASAASLPARLWALGIVSALLRDLPTLMNAARGGVLATAYALQLGECAAAVELEEGNELPALVCWALQALLMTLLGRAPDACAALTRIPPALDANPAIVRAMPLAWDMAILAATLAFILGCQAEYTALLRAVEWGLGVTAATQWACRLPAMECPLGLWVGHACAASRQRPINVCNIVSDVAVRTKCGRVCFYAGGELAAGGGGNGGGAAAAPDRKSPPLYQPGPHAAAAAIAMAHLRNAAVAPPPPQQQARQQQQRGREREASHSPPGGGSGSDSSEGRLGKLDKLASVASSYLVPSTCSSKRAKLMHGGDGEREHRHDAGGWEQERHEQETDRVQNGDGGRVWPTSPAHCGAPLDHPLRAPAGLRGGPYRSMAGALAPPPPGEAPVAVSGRGDAQAMAPLRPPAYAPGGQDGAGSGSRQQSPHAPLVSLAAAARAGGGGGGGERGERGMHFGGGGRGGRDYEQQQAAPGSVNRHVRGGERGEREQYHGRGGEREQNGRGRGGELEHEPAACARYREYSLSPAQQHGGRDDGDGREGAGEEDCGASSSGGSGTGGGGGAASRAPGDGGSRAGGIVMCR